MIAVIGAGITGLVAAQALKQAKQDVLLFEGSEHLGGNIRTFQTQGYQLELGPNSLVLGDDLHAYLTSIGLADKILPANPAAKYRYILKEGRYRKLPTGPASLLFSPVFSLATKRKVLREPNVSPLEHPEETIDAFFRRRVGDELTEYVVHPFVSGVFAGDPTVLLIGEAFPRIKQLEQTYGSLLKGMRARAKTQQHRGTISFEGGMESLPKHLATDLAGHIHPNHLLQRIESQEQGYLLRFPQGTFQAQQVILALPAHVIAQLLPATYDELNHDLRQISYPSVSMVFSAYHRSRVKHPLDGFGALHNHQEQSFTLGSIFSSTVFSHRCPADQVLLTTFVGGARQAANADLADEPLLASVHQELSRLLGITAPPVFSHIQRWPKAIPQYTSAVLPSRKHLAKLSETGLHLGGNWVGGISVPDSIKQGQQLAAAALKGASA